jgi:hypothetical protein
MLRAQLALVKCVTTHAVQRFGLRMLWVVKVVKFTVSLKSQRLSMIEPQRKYFGLRDLFQGAVFFSVPRRHCRLWCVSLPKEQHRK